ncbi:hypothetical protein MCOR25_001076 [Pyricularia grisea]|uniref:Myb-like domain-containing protein n=1 Tax=Pyricularia grisea TaxID=148305 RepID=A0A6P8ANW4_PYRGI|nr:uncharacterized protein PgNI_11701 [Pyricularia grisea]KAI6381600.1 hypothetical protein MCOR25_001076 [Pyricularia grisea]TLD03722.1 hypothetical protein PgNI_11701 [Pyricularia grisea]
MLKKKGAPSFKPKAGIRRNPAPAAAKSQSGTPAPTQPSASNDSAVIPTPTPTPAQAPTSESTNATSSVLPQFTATPPTSNTEAPSAHIQSAQPSSSAQTPAIGSPREQPSTQANSHIATQSQDTSIGESTTRDSRTPGVPSAQISPSQTATPDVIHNDVASVQSAPSQPTHSELPTNSSTSEPLNIIQDAPVTGNLPAVSSTDAASQPQTLFPAGPSSNVGTPVDDTLITPEITSTPCDSEPITATRKRGAPVTSSSEAATAGPSSEDAAAPTPKRRRTAKSTLQDSTAAATESNDSSQPGSQKKRGRTTKKPSSDAQSQETPNADSQQDGDAGPSQPKRKARTRKTATLVPDGAGDTTSAQPKKPSKSRAARATAVSNADSADDANGPGEVRTKRRSSKKPRKERSVTPEDAEERAIDPSSLTMAELTKDLRIGKKFSRHDELRDRMKTLQEKQREERRLRKANGGVTPGDEEATALATGEVPESSETTSAPTGANAGGGSSTQPAALGPQFEIINGEIVINQASLVHDRHAAAMVDHGDMEEVEENDFTRMTNQATYLRPTKIKGPNAWTKEETQQFYEYLRMFGTDFQTIANMFPGRMRRHVKMKFNREERHNPTGVNAALVGQKVVMIDLAEYQTRTGKALEPTADIEEEHRKRQEAHDAEQKRIQEEADAVQAEKRKKLLGTGTDNGTAKVAEKTKTKDKDVSDGKSKGATKSQTEIMEEEEDVEVIDEDEVEERPTRRRGRFVGIGG